MAHGVHLAVFGALSAAATISASLRNQINEKSAANFHNRCVRDSYVRFVVIVAGVYRQVRNQGGSRFSGGYRYPPFIQYLQL
jgi:hypothetical protein